MINVALNIAKWAFADKRDKGGKPYIEHILRVAENSKKYYKGNKLEELHIVALLHDLIEDCPNWTMDHVTSIFRSSDVYIAIDSLTKKKDQDYERYIININSCDLARAVKLADLEDNMDLKRLKVVTDRDLERLSKYHKSYTILLNGPPTAEKINISSF